MKKHIFTFIVMFGIAIAGTASASLWNYYQEQGLPLPSIQERSIEYAQIAGDEYVGEYHQNVFLEEFLRSFEMLGGTLPVAGATYTLAGSGVTASATSITLQSLTIPQTGKELQDSDFSDTFYATLEPGNRKRQEIVACTTVTQNANDTATLSGCSRGMLPFSPYTASTTYQFSHGGGTSLIFSDPPQLFNEYPAKSNTELITGAWAFSVVPTTTDECTATDEFCTKTYIDAGFNQGAATSTESVGGISELATQIEMASSTDLGSDQPLVLQAKNATSTPGSGLGLFAVITENDLKINQSFLDLTENWDYTGNNTHSGTETFNGTTALNTSTMFGTQGGLMPAGSITAYATGTPPTGWLLADGSSYTTASLSALFDVIGYSYGGSGANFNLPNLNGRMVIGFGSATSTYNEMGEIGGEDEHVLTENEMPSHTHVIEGVNTNNSGSGSLADGSTEDANKPTSGSTGGDAAHNNMPPFMVLVYMIKY